MTTMPGHSYRPLGPVPLQLSDPAADGMQGIAGRGPQGPFRMEADTVVITPEPRPRHGLARAVSGAREIHPVWLLNVVVLAIAAVLFVGPVQGLQPLAHPHLAWWLIAGAFAVAERCVVHLHFRRGAHSFSL